MYISGKQLFNIRDEEKNNLVISDTLFMTSSSNSEEAYKIITRTAIVSKQNDLKN